MPFRRALVPAQSFEDDIEGFGRLVDELLDDLEEAGAPLVEAQFRESAVGTRTWFTSYDGTLKLLVDEDYVAGVRCFEVVANRAEDCEALCARIRERVALIDHEAHARVLSTDAVKDPRDLFTLAYSAPMSFRAETHEVLTAVLLGSEGAELRATAATALASLGWAESRPLLALAYAMEPPGPTRLAVARALAPFVPFASDFRNMLVDLAIEGGATEDDATLAIATIEVSQAVQAQLAIEEGQLLDVPLASAIMVGAREYGGVSGIELERVLKETREVWVPTITLTMGSRPQRLDATHPVLDDDGRVIALVGVDAT
jgi:hypothetical protein